MSTDILIADSLPEQPETVELVSRAKAVEPANHDQSLLDSEEQGRAVPFSEVARDYVQLTKPRIVVMILVTTVMTAVIGAGGLIGATSMFLLLFGTAFVAASAGAANQIWERLIDQHMPRTANRPLPSGRVNTIPAALYTAALGFTGVAILAFGFGSEPAIAAAATWLMYVLIYTPMKTRTQWNTTVGAVAGALPVLIGYTATGGTFADWTGWLLVGVLVAWQYPHFMSIAWMYRKQYDEAGFKMTTTVEPTGHHAGLQSISGSIVLIASGIALAWIPGGLISPILASVGVFAATYPMLKASIRFKASPNDQSARKLLRSSLLVLPAVLLIITIRVFL